VGFGKFRRHSQHRLVFALSGGIILALLRLPGGLEVDLNRLGLGWLRRLCKRCAYSA
jgi:hypothetical protein